MMKKNQNGITLIALVITIIVLLILAAISIAMLTGENGILTKATEAQDASLKGEAEEAVKLAVAEFIADNNGKMPNTGLDENSFGTASNPENLNNINSNFTYSVANSNDVITVTATKGDTEIQVYVGAKTGKVSLVEEDVKASS